MRQPIEPLESERHRFAMQLWNERRGERLAPSRRDFEPWDFKPVLPVMMLIDVFSDPLDFRFRLSGSEIVDVHGKELTWHSIRDFASENYTRHVWQDFCELIERRQPQLCLISYVNRSGFLRDFSVLRLPLSSDGENVDMIIAVKGLY